MRGSSAQLNSSNEDTSSFTKVKSTGYSEQESMCYWKDENVIKET